MLTENQKKKLIEIRDSVEDKKLRYIITEAIKGWENSNPLDGTYGVIVDNQTQKIKTRHGNCCLLGAASLGKIVKGYSFWAKELFDLSSDEETIVVNTFDGIIPVLLPGEKPHPWFKTIKAIREVVI